MKHLLLFASLCCVAASAQSVEIETRRVPSAEVAKWLRPVQSGPIDTRERLDVWLRAKDATVRAFRLTVRYQAGDAVTAEVQIVANDAEHGTTCRIPLSGPDPKVLSITVGRLIEQESSDVPIS